jgi:hypothetical protein
MSGHDWEPRDYDGAARQPTPAPAERPEKWYRDNAAVFYALEQWQSNWEEHRVSYEAEHERPPSSHSRDKNKAAFRRELITMYGRGEPDEAWLTERIRHLERRGLATERTEKYR